MLRKLLASAYMEALQIIGFRGVTCPDSCLVYHPRFRGNMENLGRAWMSAFDNMPPGTYEIGCHPGFSTEGFSQTDPIREKRERELQVFTGRVFRECIARNQIDLITYRELEDQNVADYGTATIAA